MSGNTKLIGFKVGNRVVLERWGERTDVELSSGAVRILTDAVRDDLPTQSPPKTAGDDFIARFDPQTGRVVIDMNFETASRYREVTEKEWDDALKEAVQAHRDYYDRDEPGLE